MTIFDVPTSTLPAEGEVGDRRHRIADARERRRDRRCLHRRAAVGRTVARPRQRGGGAACADRRLAYHRSRRSGSPVTGLVGRRRRSRRPDRHRPLVCGRHQRAGRLPRLNRPQFARARRKAVGLKVSAGLGARPGGGRRRRARALGITEVAAVVGGSMGGARALEWMVSHPDKVRSALVLAVGARATADQIGTQSSQIAAIKSDPNWQGGDYYGTGPLARPRHGDRPPVRTPDLPRRGRARQPLRQ